MTKSTLLHLRIPFSYFLAPVFLLAAALAAPINGPRFFLAFTVIHFLLYPASNAFNSFYDRDTNSIGGLKAPPPVQEELLPFALALDAAAVAAGWFLSWQFGLSVLFYGLCSKLYSHKSVRLKKRPVLSWLGTVLVQGALVFLAAYFAVQKDSRFFFPSAGVFLAAAMVTILLSGFYPVTQVYQHGEDARRGDRTLSMLLGVRGTLLFSGTVLVAAAAGLCWFFASYFSPACSLLLAAALLPAAAYFGRWFRAVSRDPAQADYGHVMRFNFLSSSGLAVFSVALYMLNPGGLV